MNYLATDTDTDDDLHKQAMCKLSQLGRDNRHVELRPILYSLQLSVTKTLNIEPTLSSRF